jgi:uncharacterized protein YfaS (alpha-2-macroglobulin family)
MINDGLAGSVNRSRHRDLATTAYIAWAVFGGSGPGAKDQASPTLDYLLACSPQSIRDPYLLAVAACAIAAIDHRHDQLDSYLARLDAMKKTSQDGKLAWWEQDQSGRTMFYGAGLAGNIETTAMATLALVRAGQYAPAARAALSWLVEQKDPRGTWHSTQATVLSLKALLEATDADFGSQKERRVDIAVDGQTVRQVVIPAGQGEVMQQIDLSGLLIPGNSHRVQLTDRSDTAIGFQVNFRYHLDQTPPEPEPGKEPLSIDIAYDRRRLNVDETVTAVATLINNMSQAAPMVIVDLPIPGGFAIDPGELDELVGSQQIAKYQLTARKVIVYLERLDPGRTLKLRYRLRATMPVKVTVPDAEAYEYYDPSKRGNGGGAELQVVTA